MSSANLFRIKSFPPAMTTERRVTLNEIFDPVPSSDVLNEGNREELPNRRISLYLYSGVRDWAGLRRALAEDGLEVRAKDDILCVSGYPTRNDYNYNREIRDIVARYRRSSRSFSM